MPEIASLSVFQEIAALLVLAAAVGFVGLFLRQPLIVSFMAVGLLAGPAGLDLVHAEEHIELLAELGIVLLLFLVGLKLDLKLIAALGPVAMVTGLGQVLLTAVLGFGLALALGLGVTPSIYVAVALTFSSTIIVVKLLSDKRAIDSLYGRVALGILIVQDLVVVVAMIVLAALSADGETSAGLAATLAAVAAKGVGLLIGIGLFIRFLAEPLVERLAKSGELLVAFAIGWAALMAAGADFLGLSMELGGLLAGVSFASTRFREAIAARLSPLRDFLLLFFFVGLGASLNVSSVGAQVQPALILSIFVLVAKPAIIFLIMSRMGYRIRSGFLSGVTLGQISEFSLIFMAMGVAFGQVDESLLALVTLVGLVTITLSTYMITYANFLYRATEPLLKLFERRLKDDEEAAPADEEQAATGRYDIILFGLGRFGGAMIQRLSSEGLRVLGVDFNPTAVKLWRDRGYDVVYGDATDAEFIEHLPLAGSTWAVSSVPEFEASLARNDARLTLVHGLRAQAYQGRIAVTCHRERDREPLLKAGADLVFLPFQDAADRAVELITGDERPQRLEVIDPEGQMEIAS